MATTAEITGFLVMETNSITQFNINYNEDIIYGQDVDLSTCNIITHIFV